MNCCLAVRRLLHSRLLLDNKDAGAVLPDEPIKVKYQPDLPYHPGFTGLFREGLADGGLFGTLTALSRQLAEYYPSQQARATAPYVSRPWLRPSPTAHKKTQAQSCDQVWVSIFGSGLAKTGPHELRVSIVVGKIVM